MGFTGMINGYRKKFLSSIVDFRPFQEVLILMNVGFFNPVAISLPEP
jgi:hypothetical protein